MKTWKRALALVLALVMALSLVALPSFAEGEEKDTYTVVINYVFENNTTAAPSWTARVANGSALRNTVTSPTVVGYEADKPTVALNYDSVTQDYEIIVTYRPADVGFTVVHMQQNVNNDGYTEFEREKKSGFTDAAIGAGLAKTYPGFTALNYNQDTKVAADGSTVVEIKYDRNYYLLNLNLDGGWGVEPIYARYGTPIALADPTKAGYTFDGWTPDVPAVMPDKDQALTATWNAAQVDYTVQYWQENANDTNYSYVESSTYQAQAGTTVNGDDYKNSKSYQGFTYHHADSNVVVKGDGSTVVNVFFNRNVYQVKFVDGKLICGKVEHEHSHDECCTKTSWHIHSSKSCNTNKCPYGYEHTHSSSCYDDLIINAKYGAFIGDQWPGGGWYVDTSYNTAQSYLAIMPLGGKTFYGQQTGSNTLTATYYVEVLPGESGTKASDGRTYKQHHTDTAKSNRGLTVTDEERYDLEGFTCNESISTKNGSNYNGAAFYYTRKNFELVFDDQYGTKVSEQLPYEQVLSESVNHKNNYTPAYPPADQLEPGAYEFAGWYLDPQCTQEVDWTAKMPAAKVVLYAKWAPVQHKVTFSQTENGTSLGETTVPHGDFVQHDDPTYGNRTFIGWFYKDENDVEHAFHTSMPVRRDMDLYAKWRTDVVMNYTIHYAIRNADGTLTYIADDTTGSALAETTKTFEAKTGTELYPNYQTGYFPVVSSHSLRIDLDDASKNEYTFIYVQMDKVPYTVRYRIAGTDTQAPGTTDKVVSDNTAAIVTEKYVPVPGYMPDASYKRLVVSSNVEENVITFWYTKDDQHALVTVRHWFRNIQDTTTDPNNWTQNYTENINYTTETTGTIGVTYPTASAKLDVPGFTYVRGTVEVGDTVTKTADGVEPSAELTNQGLVLNLYYDRFEYPYEFRFVDSYTGEVITGYNFAGTTSGSARYGARVTYTAPTELTGMGYKLDTTKSAASQAIDINIEDPADIAKLNVKTFYYIPYFNVVHVRQDHTTNVTTVSDPDQENLIPSIVDNGYNLTQQVPTGFLYGGAFDSESCDASHVQQFTDGENATKYTPERGATYYIWEVPDTFLRPSNYYVSRYIDGKQTVCKLYPLTTADRLLYKEVGFAVTFGSDTNTTYIASGSNNGEFESPAVNQSRATMYQMVKAARNGKVESTLYMMSGKMNQYKGDIKDEMVDGKRIDPGYIGGVRLTEEQFVSYKENGINYTPYWITLDGVRVTGVKARNITFNSDQPAQPVATSTVVATTCTYVPNTVDTQMMNFATCFTMDDSQTTVDTRITVTVKDGETSYSVKAQPGEELSLTPAGQDGKLFAGWYVDGKATDLKGFTQDTTVTAKYVSDAYLNLDYARIGLFRVRGVTLISAVDHENNYQDVGFIIGDDDTVPSVRYANRYMLFNTPASLFDAPRGSRLVLAEQSLSGSGDLKVTPYWITMDGTEVLGETHILHYNTRGIWE